MAGEVFFFTALDTAGFLLSGDMPDEASQHLHLPAPFCASTHICQGQHGLQPCFKAARKSTVLYRVPIGLLKIQSYKAKPFPCMHIAHQELVSNFAVVGMVGVVIIITSATNIFCCAVRGNTSIDTKA